MLSEKFGLIALFYGVVTGTVMIASGVSRLRRGKVVSAQFFVSLTLVLSWVASNIAFVKLDQPTAHDLAFPYFDVVGMTLLLIIAAVFRETSLWMRYIWVTSLGQLVFHVPYLMTGGAIMPKFYYHLTLNLIFFSQNIMVALGLIIKRSRWMEFDKYLSKKLTRIVRLPYICSVDV